MFKKNNTMRLTRHAAALRHSWNNNTEVYDVAYDHGARVIAIVIIIIILTPA